MHRVPWIAVLVVTPLIGLRIEAEAQAGEKPAAPGLVVVDNAGKDQPLKGWKFAAGTRHLSWLAPEPEKGAKPKDTDGPEALVFSEGTEAPYRVRVLTLIPLEQLRALEYDAKMRRVTARVAKSDKTEDDAVVVGVTGYVDTNVLTLTAEQDLGELGVASVKFEGGAERGIRGLRFTAPKAFPKEHTEGRSAKITANDKSTHTVFDLQPIYRYADGRLRPHPTLYFQTTVKLDIAKIEKLSQVESSSGGTTFDVTIKGGKQLPLVLVERPTIDGRPAQLEGLVGRAASGYKLVPVGALREAQFDAAK